MSTVKVVLSSKIEKIRLRKHGKKLKLSGANMNSGFKKTLTVTICAVIGLGLGACSDAALKDQKSVTSGRVSQNNETKATGGVKTNESNLSSFFDITYFDFDSAELSAETRKVLDRVVDKLLTNPSARVVISGHADERGTREYNLALGHLRASAVADYMVTNGIVGLRIKKVSFGKKKPLLKVSNGEAWSRNRRVEINVE